MSNTTRDKVSAEECCIVQTHVCIMFISMSLPLKHLKFLLLDNNLIGLGEGCH